ncbi:MAG TPA: hypothetical protein VH599_14600 [Ktedonobacterales bacterium]|jgi:hypothetical protein
MDDNYFEVEDSTPLPKQQQHTDDLPQIDLEPEGPRPPSRRKRLTQIGLVLGALVVVLVTFQSALAPSHPAPSAPTPLPTIPPPLAVISSNINFGAVTINGLRQRGTVPMFFRPHDTTYTVIINASPFRPVSCTFTFFRGAPEPTGPGCSINSDSFQTITANGITAAPSYWVEIDFTARDLPADQRSQINALLAHSVIAEQTTTVPAGSYIATSLNGGGAITSRRAGAALKGTASLAASDNIWQIGFDCIGLICQAVADPRTLSAFTGMAWVIGVPAALRWRFTTSAGQMLGDVSFPVFETLPALLTYSPDNGWSFLYELDFNPPSTAASIGIVDCNTGAQVLQQQIQYMSFGFATTSADQGIEGCQITLQDTGGTGRGSFIWRFGVLLAADSEAHHRLPQLPVAPPAEIAAVQG